MSSVASSTNDDVFAEAADHTLSSSNFSPAIIDDALDSLMKHTQDDAKKFFKNKKLPAYKIKHQIKPTKKQLTLQYNTVVYTDGK